MPPLEEAYASIAQRLIDAAMADKIGWQRLEHLTTSIGARLSGSPALERAIGWAIDGMRRDGLDNGHRQRVTVAHWVRGEEFAQGHLGDT